MNPSITGSDALLGLAGEAERLDPYAERIVAAAHGLLLEHGLRRTSLADIARSAGVSEATLFRRFPNRDALLSTLVAREARAFIARVDEQLRMIEDPEQRLVTAFLAFTRSLRTHDLIRRLIVTDPDSMLPLLTTHGSPIIAIGRHYIASQARRAAADGAQLTAAPEHIAELLARIAHSLVLTPESALPVDDETALAALAHATLARLAITRDS